MPLRSTCPTTITAWLEESEDVTTACQVVDANVANAEYCCTGANHLPERRHIGSKKRDLTFLGSSSSGGCTNGSEWWKVCAVKSIQGRSQDFSVGTHSFPSHLFTPPPPPKKKDQSHFRFTCLLFQIYKYKYI